jgi:hypothetical protein
MTFLDDVVVATELELVRDQSRFVERSIRITGPRLCAVTSGRTAFGWRLTGRRGSSSGRGSAGEEA